MFKLLPVLFLGLVLGACAKKGTASSSSAASVIGTCYFTQNGHTTCIQFDAIIPNAERASGCAGATTSTVDTCPTAYSGTDSKGKCSFNYSGIVNIYRFYENSAATEEVMCQAIDDDGGTSTWIAD